ncbi:MAG: outer membrane protein assembly factor BamB family protein [Planctomycetota bacterium]|jgi:outer membrane protein assembly factor BamB
MKSRNLLVLWCVPFICSPTLGAADLPRGLIVRIGGTAPPAGEGRVIHHSRTAPGRLPYAENTVRHLVSELPVAEKEVLRVLRPLGTARIKTTAGWRNITKPWPEDIDEWTHWLHGPGSNPVAADRRVGVPRRLLWTAPPRRSRSHEKSPSLTGMVSARGRLFYISDEAPVSVGGAIADRWRLVARDAFSGALLWKRDMPDWGWKAWSPKQPMNLRWGNPRFIHRRLVAVGDHVYVTLGYSAPVSVLDAETGRVIRTIAGTEYTSEILVHRGRLILSVAGEGRNSTRSAPSLSVVAVDPGTGRILWRTDPMKSLADLSERGKAGVLKQGRLMISAGAGRVAAATTEHIVAFDLESGAEVWRRDRPRLPPSAFRSRKKRGKKEKGESEAGTAPRRLPELGTHNIGILIVHEGRVFFGQPQRLGKVSDYIPMTLVCIDAATGNVQWEKTVADWTYTTSFNVYAIGDKLAVHGTRKSTVEILDAATGESLRSFSISAVNSKHHHRCYRNKASENFIFLGKEGVECIDLRTGRVTVNRWVRGACLYGIMPANGMIYFSPEACACNLMNRLDGYGALAPAAPMVKAEHPLVKGPAYDRTVAVGPAGRAEWPQYRKGVLRSNHTPVSPASAGAWEAPLGGRLTAPTSDGVRLYLGREDEVVALNCSDGKVAWRAPDRVDSPPSLHKGLAIYGTRTGWVQCRIAQTGDLAWSFRAAPEERLVLDDSRIESAWPLHGSVLIFKDTVYAVAGRSSNLDGGLRLFALDPVSGEVKASSVFFTEQTVQRDYYEGVNDDILATDGERIFLKHMRIDPTTLAIARQQWWSFSGPDGKLKNYSKDPIKLRAEDQRTHELSASAGFLDDELFGRAHMQLDRAELCNRICFDADRSFGIRHSVGPGHFQYYIPGSGGLPVLCFDRKKQSEPAKKGQKSHKDADPMAGMKGSGLRGNPPVDAGLVWSRRLPIRPTALISAGTHILLGGGPDLLDPEDPLRGPEWRAGGLIYALTGSNGSIVSETKLPTPPVHEGMIALKAGIFACLKNGSVARLETSSVLKR